MVYLQQKTTKQPSKPRNSYLVVLFRCKDTNNFLIDNGFLKKLKYQ